MIVRVVVFLLSVWSIFLSSGRTPQLAKVGGWPCLVASGLARAFMRLGPRSSRAPISPGAARRGALALRRFTPVSPATAATWTVTATALPAKTTSDTPSPTLAVANVPNAHPHQPHPRPDRAELRHLCHVRDRQGQGSIRGVARSGIDFADARLPRRNAGRLCRAGAVSA